MEGYKGVYMITFITVLIAFAVVMFQHVVYIDKIRTIGEVHETIVQVYNTAENIEIDELLVIQEEIETKMEVLESYDNDKINPWKRTIEREIRCFNELVESIENNNDISYEYHELGEQIEKIDYVLASNDYDALG